MHRAVKLLLALALLGLGGLLVRDFALPALREKSRGSPPPPPSPIEPALPSGLAERVAAAPDLEAPAILREEMERQRDSSPTSPLRLLLDKRGETATAALERAVEAHLHQFRYRQAAEIAEEYRRAWRGTRAEAAITTLLDEVRALESDLLLRRKAEAEALLDEGRIEGAREALVTNWELEPEYRKRLEEIALEIERRIARITFSPADPLVREPVRPPDRSVRDPAPPPPLPGPPHPDVKRLKEARALLVRGRMLYAGGKHEPAEKALKELTDSYGDLAFVRSRGEALDALRSLAAFGRGGGDALFHATSATRRGRVVKLQYLFASAREMADWEALKTIPHKEEGTFQAVRGGVQGSGVMTLCLRAAFENDVTIRAIAEPARLKTHGLAFCQTGDEARQIMLLVTNHWFVEGENYVLERPGHSLIMIGKGTNNDVPIDSPDIGFIFRVTSEKPEVRPGGPANLRFRLDGETMEATVEAGGKDATIRGRAVGDDGRGMERVRPSLFVLENSVVFREVVVEGTLHASFEKERVRELLDLASRLDR
ncbi:MAG: hypothetical protein ACT4PV_07565 [Planctomycetaceae bacterium]